jgi:hypothetical protein
VHHDARVYIEMRYDNDSCDVVIVHFRDRGLLPIEVKTWEYVLDSPILGDDVVRELKANLVHLIKAVYDQD